MLAPCKEFFCGLLCLFICFQALDAVCQTTIPSEMQSGAAMFGTRPGNVGDGTQTKGAWPASLEIGWMTAPQRIRLGYDGLVPPGACVSSFFVYPLSGVQIGASLPVHLSDSYDVRLYGSYFITDHPKAGQELTWTHTVPGTREWRHSNSQWYRIGGEALYRMSGETTLLGGFRLESLLTNFSDPNPDYLFTIPSMEAQTTVTFYEPYLGIRLQPSGQAKGLSLQAVGFPFLFATIQHLNVCNNGGVPFAHTGRQNATRGFFTEISAEYRLSLSQSVQGTGFIDWNVYQGQCPMTIERHEGGPTPGVTEATVAWSHHINSLTIGGKLEFSWNSPF